MENPVNGTDGGRHITSAPLTTENASVASPALLRNAIDDRIVKIRPMSTPIDQLSRCGSARSAAAMTVDYYSVDTKLTETTLAEDFVGGRGKDRGNGVCVHELVTAADNIFDVSETILVPSVTVEAGGKQVPLVFYVVGKSTDKGLEVVAVNAPEQTDMSGTHPIAPSMTKGTRIIRMGRAATELDVQSPQFQALPRKASNFCQIFKMQVEQSTLFRIADKEAGWTLSDQEEAAIIDMRLGMEKNFLFGSRTRLFDPVKGEYVYLTGGIWEQAGDEMAVPEKVDEAFVISLCRRAFTGNNGSKRKILLAGSGLIEALSRISVSHNIQGLATTVRWGIEFKELVSNFGTLYVVHSEMFDQCGHADDGFVLDPNYMTKYVHIPFQAEKLDLRKSGQRNTDAVVLTEASCLVLRYPGAHMRLVSEAA
ncbi:MAG: DUF5309 domain-containing protein [Muribaculaceae bacterium]|nr:DUF5309 domain-containing protein [Muribaculaceae bacterium]